MGAIFFVAFYYYNLYKIFEIGKISGILSANLFENIFTFKNKEDVK